MLLLFLLTEFPPYIVPGLLFLGVFEDLFCITIFHELSQIHERHFIGYPAGFLHIVGYHYLRTLAPHINDTFFQFGGRNRIKSRGGFVQQNNAGLREGDVAGAELANFKPVEGCLKVTGKGNKQRIVPVGMEAQTEVSDYITGVRSKVAKPDCTRLFVSDDGGPISENTIKLFFSS